MKRILTLLLVAVISLAAVACGNADPSKQPTTKPTDKPSNTTVDTKDITPAKVEEAIAKALGDGYVSTVDVPKDELFTTVLAGADMEKIESYVAKQAVVSAVDMDTVVVAKVKSGYAEELVKIFNDNYSRTIDYIRQYPFGVAKVEGARLYQAGDIVVFVIGGANAADDASEEAAAKLAAAEYEKIDNAIKSLFGSLPKNLAEVKESENNNNNNNGEFDGGDYPLIGG